jgi:hypothetical protein
MQLRSGLKTSRATKVNQQQILKPKMEEKFNIEKTITNYINELTLLKNHKTDLINYFDEDEYWSNNARLIIELIHIVNENIDSISENTSRIDEFLDLFLDYKRQFLRAIEKVDFEYSNDILMNNVIYDINNFVKSVERNF